MSRGCERHAGKAFAATALLSACSLIALALASSPVRAQPTPAQQPPSEPPAADDDGDERRIVVIGNRTIITALENVPIEQTYDEDRVASYAVSTLAELLDELRAENGDAEPSVLVNGQPVQDLGDIADLPVEAIARIEALPRGAAQRVGGGAGQRAYNVVLRPAVRSATLTGSREVAIEDGWSEVKGEVLLTYIAGQDRANLTFRASDTDPLFEAERDFVPRGETVPFSPIGNIIPFTGTQVDPLLSALAGVPVSVVGLPLGITRPTLGSLVAGANVANPSGLSQYRTLRGANRPFELALAGNKAFGPWLAFSFSGRMNWTDSESFSGLPTGRFLIPADNPFTPFGGPVFLALNDPRRPLRNRSESTSGSLSGSFNATFGPWRASLTGRYDERERTGETEFSGALGALGTVGATTNPFDGALAPLIPVNSRTSFSNTITRQVNADAEGPLLSLWAGPVRGRLAAGAVWLDLEARDTSGTRSFERHEYSAKAGVTVPLTSQESAFLPFLGESEVAFDIGVLDLGPLGTLDRHSVALNWQPIAWLRLVASEVRDERAIAAELLAAPEVVTPNVPYFDPLTGQTVDVTTVYGGASTLDPEAFRTRTLSLSANPWPIYSLHLTADYLVTDLDNQIGALPPPSSAVVAAFPDRFVRDALGTLILVDNRSVNFAQQHSAQLRFGIGFTIPLVADVTIPADRETGTARRRIPGLKLQVNASHSYLLESTTVIRAGLPEIDLLEGGAIGIGGGQQRHATTGSIALTRGRSGMRAELRRRGASYLVIGSLAAPDLLTFDPITTADYRAFVDLGEMFQESRFARDTRLSLVIENVFNERQRVTNALGVTPQAYQPVYRDPVGRTILLELRKVF